MLGTIRNLFNGLREPLNLILMVLVVINVVVYYGLAPVQVPEEIYAGIMALSLVTVGAVLHKYVILNRALTNTIYSILYHPVYNTDVVDSEKVTTKTTKRVTNINKKKTTPNANTKRKAAAKRKRNKWDYGDL